MATPLQGTVSAANAIERVKYSHDGMIDLILGKPGITQNELAAHFGYTAAWVSRVVNSSAFQARLAERKTEVVDPTIVMALEEKFEAAAHLSLDVLQEKLSVSRNPDLALKVGELASKALGFGARQANVNVQQNFIVPMPQKAASEADWAERHGNLRAGIPRGEAVEDARVLSEGSAAEKSGQLSPDLNRLMEGV